jgi:hypothetical protein
MVCPAAWATAAIVIEGVVADHLEIVGVVNPGTTLDERFCSPAVPMAAIYTEALHIS